jgi:tetratricopeptide (TPR) repeat protein
VADQRKGDDAGNLLRDLRSLRDSGQGGREPSIRLPPSPPPPPPPQSGGNARGILFVLFVVLLVVGLAAYGSGLMSDGKTVLMPPSGASSPSPGASVASATASPNATGTVATPSRHVDLGDEIPHGLEPAKVGVYYALARFLITMYDPAVQPALRFAQPASPEVLAAVAGPAAWYGQLAHDRPDEVSVVVSATTSACTVPDAKRRTLVEKALVRVVNDPATALQVGLSSAIQGEDARAVKELEAVKPPDADQRLALALAKCLAGQDLAQVEKDLGAAGGEGGWLPALRAHLALMQNRRDEAIQYLNQANGAAHGAAELFFAAGLAMRLGQLPLANGLLERVKVALPGDVHAVYLRGLIAEQGGRHDEAHKLYDQALRGCEDPRLAVAARTKRALMLQKKGEAEAAWRDVLAVEDIDMRWPGLLLLQARSATKVADDAVGPGRIDSLTTARVLWQKLLVQHGPTPETISSLLKCYTQSQDQGSARHGIVFLQLLLDQQIVTQAPQRSEIASVVAVLQERIRPRPIYEEAPR